MKKREETELHFGNKKKISVRTQVCDNVFSQARGLMFRKKEKAPALVFKFNQDVKEPIHSLFVLFPFVSLWLNKKGEVIEKRTVKPWKFYVSPKRKFRSFVEIPLNEKYRKITDDIERFK